MRKIIKSKSKIDAVQSVIIGVLVLIILLMNLPQVNRFIGMVRSDDDRLREYETRLSVADEANRVKDQKIVALEFDRIRLEDASNMLLALQDYFFDKGEYPDTLGQLREAGYVDSLVRLEDPERKEPYLYRKLDGRFVLCIRLSDMLKGVNTQYCDAERLEELRAAPAAGGELKIVGTVSGVNIREAPTTSSKIVYQAKPNESFSYVEAKDGWYRVELDSSGFGWVLGEYVVLAP